MTKILSILLAVSYLIGISSIDFSVHYCGKKFQYVSHSGSVEKKSCCGHTDSKHDCCKDEKVKSSADDQLITKVATVSFNGYKDIVFGHLYEYIENNVFFCPDIYVVSHSPPLLKTVKIHILNCSYLI